uniref:Uncharacterized protein n=1 Tax=Timema genevievae TaxID=629358 RepID=A0A7R9K2V1_TIMGE|nr:unnamed protein product [Timema genevievae]
MPETMLQEVKNRLLPSSQKSLRKLSQKTMQDAIMKLVMHSFGIDEFIKAVAALKLLREKCKELLPVIHFHYNELLEIPKKCHLSSPALYLHLYSDQPMTAQPLLAVDLGLMREKHTGEDFSTSGMGRKWLIDVPLYKTIGSGDVFRSRKGTLFFRAVTKIQAERMPYLAATCRLGSKQPSNSSNSEATIPPCGKNSSLLAGTRFQVPDGKPMQVGENNLHRRLRVSRKCCHAFPPYVSSFSTSKATWSRLIPCNSIPRVTFLFSALVLSMATVQVTKSSAEWDYEVQELTAWLSGKFSSVMYAQNIHRKSRSIQNNIGLISVVENPDSTVTEEDAENFFRNSVVKVTDSGQDLMDAENLESFALSKDNTTSYT